MEKKIPGILAAVFVLMFLMVVSGEVKIKSAENEKKQQENREEITFDYEKVNRNSEKYEGKAAIIGGRVLQVMGSRQKGYTLRVAQGGDLSHEMVWLVDSEDTPEYKILENDWVMAYAILLGDYTYEMISGEKAEILTARATEIRVKDQ